MHRKFIQYLIIFVFQFSLSSAQFNYYPFFLSDSSSLIKLADDCSKNINVSFVLPEHISSGYKKEYNNYKEESSDYAKSLIKNTGMLDSIINPFVQSVYSKIAESNPELKGYTIVVSDWPIMNAAFIGGHVIMFYVPLLSRMQNESQIASVLCHELAHGELDHLQKGLKKKLDEYYSKEFQKELKKTLKEEFNTQKKLDLLALKFTFGSRYHDRSLEKAADSLGYLFLSKTQFDANEFPATLEILRRTDEPVSKDSINYEQLFKCPSSAFNFSSIKPYKKTSIFNVEEENKASMDSLRDSLRTHPDCEKRIGFIRNLMKSNPTHTGKQNSVVPYSKIQWASAMEMIQGFYSYEYYDYSLFNTLLYLEKDPENEFLKYMVVINLYELFDAMKNHELSDYTTNYDDDNPAEFNNLLFLINNLRLSEVAGFSNCFQQAHFMPSKQNEYGIATGYCIAKMSDGTSNEWQELYKAKFKNGRFTNLLDLNPKKDKKKKK